MKWTIGFFLFVFCVFLIIGFVGRGGMNDPFSNPVAPLVNSSVSDPLETPAPDTQTPETAPTGDLKSVNTPTITHTPTPSPTPAAKPMNSPAKTYTPTQESTFTPSPTPTHTPALVPTLTPTSIPIRTPVPAPTNTTVESNTRTLTHNPAPIPTPTVTPVPTIVPPGVNLVANPGFESGKKHWETSNCTVSSTARSGFIALQLGEFSTCSGYAQQNIDFAEPGASLSLSAYGQLTSVRNVLANLEVHFYNERGGEIGSGILAPNFSTAGAYQSQKVDFTTPAGVAKIRVKICFTVNQSSQYALIDDVRIIKR